MVKKRTLGKDTLILIVCAVVAAIITTGGIVYLITHPELRSPEKNTPVQVKDWGNPESTKSDQENPTVSKPSESSVAIDFATCEKGNDSFSFAFGSTHFYFEGIEDGYCHFYMGTEIENPQWDGTLNTECKVPTDYSQTYSVRSTGAYFSFTDTHCKPANYNRTITT